MGRLASGETGSKVEQEQETLRWLLRRLLLLPSTSSWCTTHYRTPYGVAAPKACRQLLGLKCRCC